MKRYFPVTMVLLILGTFPLEKLYSQTPTSDSLVTEPAGVETVQQERAPVESIAPIKQPAEDKTIISSGNLEGFSMYNFGAAYFYSSQKMNEIDWWDGTVYTYTYTTTVFAGGASWNYMVFKGLSLGGSLGLLNLSTSRSGSSGSYFSYSGYSSSISMTLIGPRIAKYFGSKKSNIIPFIAGEMDIITSSSGTFSNSETVFRLGGGAVFKFIPNVGLSFGLDYLKFEDQKDATNIMGTLGLVCMPYKKNR
jgi:hypothetical protein